VRILARPSDLEPFVTETRTPRPSLARLAVYLAAAWLLAWAAMKLFFGNPMEVPELVRANSPFEPELTFKLAISVELSIACLAVVRPAWGWLPMAGLYAFFVALLVPMVASGAESCGCGGGAIKMPPLLMMSIDAALLAGLLVTKPWRALAGKGLSPVLLVVGLAVAWAAPWLVIRSAKDIVGPITAETVKSGGIRYVELSPEKWKGQAIHDVAELTRWIEPEKLPVEGSIVAWRQSCPHCAKHLRELATKDDGSRQFLLVQVQDDLANSPEVDAMPQGDHVTKFAFPENLQGAFTTPFEAIVSGGIVTEVHLSEDLEPAEGG
jgi:hypothetical protein